jgi:hypothetical protein
MQLASKVLVHLAGEIKEYDLDERTKDAEALKVLRLALQAMENPDSNYNAPRLSLLPYIKPCPHQQ